MGFRYRKSINLGGGFRINLSKSGVGYSWGVKGFRITKTANGTTRRTYSIPGTGISYVDETGKSKSNPNQGCGSHICPNQSNPVNNNYYDTQNIENDVASAMVSEGLEEMLQSAKKSLMLNQVSVMGSIITLLLGFVYPILLIFSVGFLSLMIYVRVKGKINLEYSIEDDQINVVDTRVLPMIKIASSKKVWRVMQTNKVIDTKYSAGANNAVKRVPCKATTTIPFPFTTNAKVASFKAGKETLIFLPDKLFIIQGAKIGALNYIDISTSSHLTRFIEQEAVPRDAQIVDYTWKYVNKNGEADKRFKDNIRFPICLYGELELRSSSGLNTDIIFSNAGNIS